MSRKEQQTYWLYGHHSCLAALENPRRKIHKLLSTKNAAHKYNLKDAEIVDDKAISRLLTRDAVHQGIACQVNPLNDGDFKIDDLGNLVVFLDEITDPHNIGAIMRSASAFGASAVVTTFRNSPPESGVLAKSASGALEYVRYLRVRNLVQAMDEFKEHSFRIVGLAGKTEVSIQNIDVLDRMGIVLGAEGKGLRQITMEHCDIIAKIPMSERQESLNVSNAGAIALWEISKLLTV